MERGLSDIGLSQIAIPIVFSFLLSFLTVFGFICLLYCCVSLWNFLCSRKNSRHCVSMSRPEAAEHMARARRYNTENVECTFVINSGTCSSVTELRRNSITLAPSAPPIDIYLALPPSKTSRKIEGLPPKYQPPPAYNECAIDIHNDKVYDENGLK